MKVGLCLSGGAALGACYVGIIDELLKNNIAIDMISGSSFGALVGAFYAAGYSPKQMSDLLLAFKRRSIADVSLFNDGLLRGNRVVKYLDKHFKDKNIEDLNIPFCAVTCNLITGEKISQRSGNLTSAVRASCSVPMIFSPVKRDGMLLIDGGVIDNMPVQDLREMGADFIISVDIHNAFYPEGNLDKIMSVMISTLKLMLKVQTDLKTDKGDVYITPVQPDICISKFAREEMEKSIEYGRVAVKKHIDEIKQKLSQLN